MDKPARRLGLRRAEMSELTPDELARTAGGYAPPTLQEGCDTEDLAWALSIHQHCTWTCI